MRDILVCLLVFGSLPYILRYPFFGIVVWTWLGLMNPHKMAWGFSTMMPFAFIVLITFLVSLLISREPKRIPITIEVVILALFVLWMFITTLNALYPTASWEIWSKVWRIQFAIVLTLMLTTTHLRLQALAWTIAVSLGFYGFKGGIWTLLTGGGQRVYGPPETFIGGNNELGLALIMTIPMIWFLVLQTKTRWIKWGLYSVTVLSLIATVGTHSRGALVGVAAMGIVFLLKSRRRVLPIVVSAAFVALLPNIMGENWFERMETIETYEQDDSAMERIRAWGNAINLANERFMGGGYDALIWYGGRDAHSIYFEVLGEHGYLGLMLFLTLAIFVWLKASRVQRLARDRADLRWAADLCSMIQVSMVGYAVAGAFLGLAYFDLYYLLIAMVISAHRIVVATPQTTEKQATLRASRNVVHRTSTVARPN